MSKLLIVAQSFPPVASSHTNRVVAFAKRLKSSEDVLGVSIAVGDGFPNYDDSITLPILVERIFPGAVHFLAHSKNSSGFDVLESKPDFISIIKKQAIRFYRKIELVDSYMDWIPHLALWIRKNLEDSIILSMSMPNSVHVAVLIAILGRSNYWIADFADPWTLDHSLPRRGLRSYIERFLEGRIISRADAVVFVTNETLNSYTRKYPAHRHKMHLVRMGYESNLELASREIVRQVFYGGSLPMENRNPSEFFEAIKKMEGIKFVFAGECVNLIKEHYGVNIPANVTLINWLNHSDYIRHLEESEVSVIFGNSNVQQIPGKVYQYYAHANKILYISNMPHIEDESLMILDGKAEICFNSHLSIEMKLEKLFDSEPKSREDVDIYSWDKVSRDMQIIIDQIERTRGHI